MTSDPRRNCKEICSSFNNVNLSQLLGKRLQENDSVFNSVKVLMFVMCGVPREVFDDLDVSIKKVQITDVEYSKKVSDDKTSSAVPPETQDIAVGFKYILDLMT